MNRVQRKAKENSWPQFDAVTIPSTTVGIHGVSLVLLRRHTLAKRGQLKKGEYMGTTSISFTLM